MQERTLTDFTEQEAAFISEVVMKELFFALAAEEPTTLTDAIHANVETELFKLEAGEFGDGREDEIATAKRILAKLRQVTDMT